MPRVTEIRIKGVSPLLMHKFPMEPVEKIENRTPEEQAEFSAYRMENGSLFIPSVAMQRSLVAGATFSKGKGRSTLQKESAACLMVDPAELDLAATEYQIDSRPVVIRATKGRIVRHRPRLDAWSVDFRLTWDETLLKEEQVRRIVDDTGQRVGLLDFRPACKGPFGRFVVTRWETLPRDGE